MRTTIIDDNREFGRVAWRNVVKTAPPRRENAAPIADPAVEELQRMEWRLRQVEADSADRVRESYEDGFSAGQSSVKAQADTQIRDCLERAAQAIAELTEVRKRMFDQAESDMVKLSMEIARRILNRELSIDPDAVESLIKGAMDKLQGHAVHKVRVHPEHQEIVRSYIHQLGSAPDVEIVADPSRERGAVVFELGSGSLDASIETQLREIERGLADKLSQ